VADPQLHPPDGTPVQLWDCRPEPGQRWELRGSQLVSGNGKCLDIQGPLTDSGTPLQVWTCQDVPQHQWRIY
jgi:hypothetical protein